MTSRIRVKVKGGKRFLPSMDMSLPLEPPPQRKTNRTTRAPVPAQMNHGSGQKADKLRRQGEAALRRQRRGKGKIV